MFKINNLAVIFQSLYRSKCEFEEFGIKKIGYHMPFHMRCTAFWVITFINYTKYRCESTIIRLKMATFVAVY